MITVIILLLTIIDIITREDHMLKSLHNKLVRSYYSRATSHYVHSDHVIIVMSSVHNDHTPASCYWPSLA